MKSSTSRLASAVARLKSLAVAASEAPANGEAPASRMQVLDAEQLQHVAGGPIDEDSSPKGAWSATATGAVDH